MTDKPLVWMGDLPIAAQAIDAQENIQELPKDIKCDEATALELGLSELGLSESRLELYPPGCLLIVARSGILKRTLPGSINRVPAVANQDMKVMVPFVEGK